MGIVALAACLDSVNVRVRSWLRDEVFGGMPFWLDNATVMLALSLAVWGTIGYLLLGRVGLGVRRPERPREAWSIAIGSGFGLLVPIAIALAIMGKLSFKLGVDVPGILANFASNFYEE